MVNYTLVSVLITLCKSNAKIVCISLFLVKKINYFKSILFIMPCISLTLLLSFASLA